MIAVRCAHEGCTGNLFLETVLPGLSDLTCLLCGRNHGDVTEPELREEWGFSKAEARAIEKRPMNFLWAGTS